MEDFTDYISKYVRVFLRKQLVAEGWVCRIEKHKQFYSLNIYFENGKFFTIDLSHVNEHDIKLVCEEGCDAVNIIVNEGYAMIAKRGVYGLDTFNKSVEKFECDFNTQTVCINFHDGSLLHMRIEDVHFTNIEKRRKNEKTFNCNVNDICSDRM